MIYLDHAATSPPNSTGIKALFDAFTNQFANPSSNHILGKNLKNVNTCISINGEYKHLMLPRKLPFVISNICGEDDEIVDPKNCQNSHKLMIKQGNTGEFILLSETGHQINNKIVKTVLDTLDISAN